MAMRGPAVLLLLSCFALVSTKHVKSNTKLLVGQRDMDLKNSQNPLNKLFNLPATSVDMGLQPPPYMNSLLNQILDLKGGGHLNYLNVYPSSWTTNQVNSELTVDVQFTALVNSQNVHCSAHISASMPPSSNGNPLIVQAGSTIHCTSSTPVGGNPQSLEPVSQGAGYGNNRYGYNEYRNPGYDPGTLMPQQPMYNIPVVPPYYVPRGPQVVYRTKYVPITIPTLVPPPPVPATLPVAPTLYGPPPLPGGPIRMPQFNIPGGPIGIPPYNGLPINDVMPFMPNYAY